MSSRQPRKLTDYGEVWILGSIFGFAGANFLDRTAVTSVDPLVGPLLKNLPSLFFAAFLLLKRRTFRELMPRAQQYLGRRVIWLFLLSGLAAAGGLLFYFNAIKIGGVVITPPFLQTQMIWAALFGWLFLKEKLSGLAILGIVIAAGGLMVLSYGQSLGRPVSPRWFLAIPIALSGAVCYAATGTLTRQGQLQGADQSTGMFLRFIASSSAALAVLLILRGWEELTSIGSRDLGALLLSGVLSGPIAVYCFFTALRLMSVGRTFALNGLNSIVAAFLGYFFLNEYMNTIMVLGILVTCCGVAMVQIFKPTQEKKAT